MHSARIWMSMWMSCGILKMVKFEPGKFVKECFLAFDSQTRKIEIQVLSTGVESMTVRFLVWTSALPMSGHVVPNPCCLWKRDSAKKFKDWRKWFPNMVLGKYWIWTSCERVLHHSHVSRLMSFLFTKLVCCFSDSCPSVTRWLKQPSERRNWWPISGNVAWYPSSSWGTANTRSHQSWRSGTDSNIQGASQSHSLHLYRICTEVHRPKWKATTQFLYSGTDLWNCCKLQVRVSSCVTCS